jgi:hypothetical protein
MPYLINDGLITPLGTNKKLLLSTNYINVQAR